MNITVISTGSEKGNSYLVEDGHTSILLDAGASIEAIKKAVDFDVTRISAALVTHEHGDHSRSADKLLFYGVDIYASNGTLTMIGLEDSVHAQTVKSMRPEKIGTFRVVPFVVEHDAAEPLGFVVDSIVTGERLLYFTDTAYVRYLFPRVDVILGECNHSSDILEANAASGRIAPELAARITKNHMSLERLLVYLGMMDKTKLKKVVMIHASDANADDELFLSRVRAATGLEVEIA